MNTTDLIIQRVANAACGTRRSAVVVGIAGAGCIGKTTLAHQIAFQLGEEQCQVLSLDGYLLEREERVRHGITGYNARGYELERAATDLRMLLGGRREFALGQFNRRTGLRDVAQRIHYRPYIVVEGSLALDLDLRANMDVSIFMHATRAVQFQLRLRREQLELGHSFERVRQRFREYYRDYGVFVKPQMNIADVVVTVNEQYQISAYSLPASAR